MEKPSDGSNGRRDQAIRDNEVELGEARSETIEQKNNGFRRGDGPHWRTTQAKRKETRTWGTVTRALIALRGVISCGVAQGA